MAKNTVLSSPTDQKKRARCALVPIKALIDAKQRLNPALTQSQRQQLSQAMAHDVLSALSSVPNLALSVCAGDDFGVELAQKFNATLIHDSELPSAGLDAIAATYSQRMTTQGYSHAMIVHADIPLLTTNTLERIFDSEASHDVILVTDRHGAGTNIVSWRLRSGFATNFGTDSRARHLTQCAELNLRACEIHCDNAALDIDTPSDLQLLYRSRQGAAGTQTRRFLDQVSTIASMSMGGVALSVAANA